MVLLGVFFSFSSALAASPVEIRFTQESAREWVSAFHQIDEDANCTAQALRPDRGDSELKSESNQIVCTVPSRNETFTQSFADSLVDSWGSQNLSVSFEIESGELLDQMIPVFREKSSGATDTMKEGDRWNRLTTCGPPGMHCDQAYFLNTSGVLNSAAQVACTLQSELISVFSNPLDPRSYGVSADYYNDLIDQQLASGARVYSKKSCIFIE